MELPFEGSTAGWGRPLEGLDARPFYSISQAAQLLGVSRATIWRRIRAGQLPVRRLGHRTVRITREDLNQLVDQSFAVEKPTQADRSSGGHAAGAAIPVPEGVRTDGWPGPANGEHFAQFYESDGYLVEAVGDFILASLQVEGSGIIIATEDHRAGIEDRLRRSGLDVVAARAAGRYISLNAAETLLRIMDGGAPDPKRFREIVGGLLTRSAIAGRRVHIFGEMVALLMANGSQRGALRLEELWNELRRVQRFTLMCAYPMEGFGGESLAETFRDVCAEHSYVLPAESFAAELGSVERLRTVAELQQKAYSLEADILQRRQLAERLLRLQEITGQLSRSLDAEKVLASIARSAADLLQVPVGAVFLLEDGDPSRDFTLAAAFGIDEAQTPHLRLPRHASLAGRAIDQGQTLVVDDVRTTPGTALPALLTGEIAGSEIAAPIMSHAKTFGVVKAFSATVRRFSPDDAALLTSLAAAAAVALTNAQLYLDARDAIRLRDEFLSAAAHDLKTPLTTVKGMAQLLRRRLTRSEPPIADWLVDGLASIDATATEMGQQLDELLDLARLQLGQRLELRRSPIDCVQLTRRVVEEQQRLSDRHKLRVDAAVDELVGEWDAIRLGRVLENLLSNAVKYSPAGGEVVVSVAPQEIDGLLCAVVAVRDQGLGIPAADLPHIFDRFRRATNVDQLIGGTGIGLTSVRQIVEQHGGTVAVESEEGVGSVFVVSLPLAPVAAEGRPSLVG